MDIRTVNNIRCYSGDIAPEIGVVFDLGNKPGSTSAAPGVRIR